MNELEYFNAADPSDRQGFRTINVNENDQPYAGTFIGPPVTSSATNTPSSTRFTICCKATLTATSPHPTFRDGAYNNLVLGID